MTVHDWKTILCKKCAQNKLLKQVASCTSHVWNASGWAMPCIFPRRLASNMPNKLEHPCVIHVNFARGWQVLSPLLRETSEGDVSCDLGNHALHFPCANLLFILIFSTSKPTPKKKTQSWTYKGILFLWVLACSLKLQLFASSCVRKLWSTFLVLSISK